MESAYLQSLGIEIESSGEGRAGVGNKCWNADQKSTALLFLITLLLSGHLPRVPPLSLVTNGLFSSDASFLNADFCQSSEPVGQIQFSQHFNA